MIQDELHELYMAIRMARRAGITPPIKLRRRVRVLELIQTWTRKQKLAATMLKKYRKKARYYEKGK